MAALIKSALGGAIVEIREDYTYPIEYGYASHKGSEGRAAVEKSKQGELDLDQVESSEVRAGSEDPFGDWE